MVLAAAQCAAPLIFTADSERQCGFGRDGYVYSGLSRSRILRTTRSRSMQLDMRAMSAPGNSQMIPRSKPTRRNSMVSAGNRERIFDWAKQAQYFAGKLTRAIGKLAFTGTKMLSYQDGPKSNTARYNYSNLEAVRQLTSLFQNMARHAGLWTPAGLLPSLPEAGAGRRVEAHGDAGQEQ